MIEGPAGDKQNLRKNMLLGSLPPRPQTRRARDCDANFIFVNRQALLAHFEKLLPLAVRWASGLETRILREGLPLSEQELTDANAIGVREPRRVRLLSLSSVPVPDDLTLRTSAAAIRFLTPATRGLALRYGIFVRSDCWRDRRLIAHELVHTAQYERLGGIEPFLRQYLWECLTIGYPEAPLEQEAILNVALRGDGLD